jgi:hypothetical protein
VIDVKTSEEKTAAQTACKTAVPSSSQDCEEDPQGREEEKIVLDVTDRDITRYRGAT